jgi:hypothetical protein
MTWRAAYRAVNIFPVQKFNEVLVGLLVSGEVVSDADISADFSRIAKRGTFICLSKYAKKGVDKE